MATPQSGVDRWIFMAAACYAAVTPVLAGPVAGTRGEQITVQETPYVVRQQVIERGNMSKMELQQTSVSKAVTYSDLDLSKESDVAILKDRVRRAAWDTCREADRHAESSLYRRLGVVPDCVATAKQQALANVNRIVVDVRAGRTVAAK